MAGDPDLETTAKILLELQANGADMIELGIPYSDPLADGPIIQLAASRALSAGTSPDRVFKMLFELRDQLTIPIILFTYSNPLINKGLEEFCLQASKHYGFRIHCADIVSSANTIFWHIQARFCPFESNNCIC